MLGQTGKNLGCYGMLAPLLLRMYSQKFANGQRPKQVLISLYNLRYCHTFSTDLFSNKECPLCRVKLASRRDSCPDNNYDAIVKAFTANLIDVPSHKSGSTFDAAAYRKAHEENISTFRKRQQQFVMGNARGDKRNRAEPRGELQTVCLSLLPCQEQPVKAMVINEYHNKRF